MKFIKLKLAHHQAWSNKGVDAKYHLRALIFLIKLQSLILLLLLLVHVTSLLRLLNVIIPLRLFIKCTSMYASHIHYPDFLSLSHASIQQ